MADVLSRPQDRDKGRRLGDDEKNPKLVLIEASAVGIYGMLLGTLVSLCIDLRHLHEENCGELLTMSTPLAEHSLRQL
jgi:hypothetical protein